MMHEDFRRPAHAGHRTADPDPDGRRHRPHRHDGPDHGRRACRHHPDGHEQHGNRRRRDPAGGRSAEGHGHRGRGRGRAQRGDVRAAILLLLADEPMHGYQLMHAIAERTGGAWRPSPGAIYPTIAVLEDEGLVSVTADGGRKLVGLTDAGREYLETETETIGDPFTAITAAGGGRNSLRGATEQLHAAVRAVSETGSDAQIAAALHLLDRTRRSLYLILAGEPGTAAAPDIEPGTAVPDSDDDPSR